MGIYVFIIILFVLAIILENIIGWAGGILHSVSSGLDNKYAVFTFREDRNQSMSTNILMNVFMPNVFMIFIYMFLHSNNLQMYQKYIIIFVLSYYIYRWMLICIIKHRKELYRYSYEIIMALCGLLLSDLLNRYFFINRRNVFISIEELRPELWLTIIFVLYKFIIQIIDKVAVQRNVVTTGMISKYIMKKFDIFFNKYERLMEMKIENRYILIFTYAVMIFEDYNRGSLIRKIEKIKFKIKKKATLGIMQFPTTELITDEMSVIKAFEYFKNETANHTQFAREEDHIARLAWNYNNDTNYEQSVVYIYNCLFDYLDSVPRYRNYFMLRVDYEDKNEYGNNDFIEEVAITQEEVTFNTINVTSPINFFDSISDDTYIVWKKGVYDILDFEGEYPQVKLEEVYDGTEVIICNVSNLYIDGNGTNLVVSPRYAHILTFRYCNNIQIKNFSMGHIPHKGYCNGAVLKFENCKNITLDNVELYGCGTYGIELVSSINAYFNEIKIFSCSYGAISSIDSTFISEDFEIFDCHNIDSSLIDIINSNAILINGSIYNNFGINYILKHVNSNLYINSLIVKNNSYRYLINHEIIGNITLEDNTLITDVVE